MSGSRDGERLIANQVARAPDGMAEAEWGLLAREGRGARQRQLLIEEL